MKQIKIIFHENWKKKAYAINENQCNCNGAHAQMLLSSYFYVLAFCIWNIIPKLALHLWNDYNVNGDSYWFKIGFLLNILGISITWSKVGNFTQI